MFYLFILASDGKVDQGAGASSPGGSGGIPVASQLKTGSVMDFLSGGSKSTSSGGGIKAASSLKSGSVMDILGGAKPSSSGSSIPTATALKKGSVMDILGPAKKEEKSLAQENNVSFKVRLKCMCMIQ